MDTDFPIEERRKGLLGWCAAHRKTTGLMGVLILLVIAGFVIDQVAENRLEDRLDAIRAAGEPMTIEDLISAYPDIPDEENMALILIEHAKKISEFSLDDEQQMLIPLIGSRQRRLPNGGVQSIRQPSTGQHFPLAEAEAGRAYLEGVAEDLDGIHRALRLKRGCLPVQWSTPAISLNMNISELSFYRHAAKVLALEAIIAAERGDPQRAGEVIEEMLHLDRAQQCNSTLIAFLVRMACHTLAQSQVERSINLSEMDERVLLSLQSAFAAFEGEFAFEDAMMTERVMFLDTLTWMRSGSGTGTAVALTPGSASVNGGWYRFIPAIPELDMSAGLDVYADLIEATDRPCAKSVMLMRDTSTRAENLPKYCLFSRMLVMGLSRSVELWLRAIGSNRAIRAGLACERFRLVTGHWPDDLDALIPDYLSEIPLDPFDDQPIRFVRTDQGVKVYCIGGDLTDDSGDIRRLEVPRNSNDRPTDRGWIFLNPDLRGRPAPERED